MSEVSYDPSLALNNAIRIPVFVEDDETKVYFENAFPELCISYEFIVASGTLGVASRIQEYSLKHHNSKAFGIRDRDYGDDDFPNWPNAKRCSFALRRHEIENYCLDWKAISSCASVRLNVKVEGGDIEAFARGYAKGITCAVAYNSLISKLEKEIHSSVLQCVRIYSKPYESLSSEEADKTIRSIEDVRARLSKIKAYAFSSVEDMLDTEIKRYMASLESGDWLVLFPGKEILDAIRCRFFATSPNDDSLIRFVAQHQKANDCIAEDLTKLKDVIVGKSVRDVQMFSAQRHNDIEAQGSE